MIKNFIKNAFSIFLKIIGTFYAMVLIWYFVSTFISFFIANVYEDENEYVRTADGFSISSYNVILDVKKDNKVEVTENITVSWFEEHHHGIYKFTPEWLEYTDKNGQKIKRKSIVKDYRAEGDMFSLDVVKNKPRIKIGNPNAYEQLGPKLYTIKYTYDMGSDPFKGFDEFIFHTFGDYWGTTIQNASLEIHMPYSFDESKINFFTDKYRMNDVTDLVDYSVDGKTIYATFNEQKNYEKQLEKYCGDQTECDEKYFSMYRYNPLSRSLTVDIELPDKYFQKGSWNYGFGSIAISIVVFVLTICTILKWNKYGKDFPKMPQTIEFYPPDNLSSAEIGYVYGQHSSKKLTISLIVSLASKGYIKIDELKDKDKKIQITNLAIKPKAPKPSTYNIAKRVIEINKLKDIGFDLTSSEKTMMKYLFKNSNTKKLDTNVEKFLEVKDSLISKGYIEIISDNEQNIYDQATIEKIQYEQKVQEYEKELVEYEKIVSKLQPQNKLEGIVYESLFSSEDVIILSEHKTFYSTFDAINNELDSKFKDIVVDKNATDQMIKSIFTLIIVVILNIASFYVVKDLDPNFYILYPLAFACIFINLFFIFFMKRKTEYGEKITAQVLGFRDFLKKVEKEKLEALVEENPHYFYDILPYTYALNISKKWIKKFENIPMPEVNMGTFDYSSDTSYMSFYNDIYYPEPRYSGGSSSGCSSCGGGCSSCGGGCSSCGGGGSW